MNVNNDSSTIEVDEGGGSYEKSDKSVDSVSLNELGPSLTLENDIQGLALLRQIFPDEPTEELRRIHAERILKYSGQLLRADNGDSNKSSKRNRAAGHGDIDDSEILPADFLRLPPSKAVRRFDEHQGRWYYEIVDDLERRALVEHEECCALVEHKEFFNAMQKSTQEETGRTTTDGDSQINPLSSSCYYTKVVFRDSRAGELGLTLCQGKNGFVRVHSSTRQMGIEVGDILIGINGSALLMMQSSSNVAMSNGSVGENALLKCAVLVIRCSPDPTVLHFQRRPASFEPLSLGFPPPPFVSVQFNKQAATPSLLDTTLDDVVTQAKSVELSFTAAEPCLHSTPLLDDGDDPVIHGFVAGLRSLGVVKDLDEQLSCK